MCLFTNYSVSWRLSMSDCTCLIWLYYTYVSGLLEAKVMSNGQKLFVRLCRTTKNNFTVSIHDETSDKGQSFFFGLFRKNKQTKRKMIGKFPPL